VHHWNLKRKPEGFVIIIKKEFVDELLAGLQQLFYRLSGYNYFQLSSTNTLQLLFQLLIKEMQSDSTVSRNAIEGLLKTLLDKILSSAITDVKQKNNSDAFANFIVLLSDGKTIKRNVKAYAEQLNTTPQNLNSICRKAINRSASEVLSDYTIKEAKRLLLYTNRTISEIAFQLDFKDVSHFVVFQTVY
jgi:AraC-like DNA-binding protein